MTKTTEKSDSIAIVGAGIVGICTALYLQRSGHNVTMYDKSGIAQGASKGNAGHFATEQVFPLADVSLLPQLPKMLLDPLGPFRIKLSYLFKALPWFLRFLNNMRPSLFNRNKQALKALNEASMAAYIPLIEAACAEPLFTQQGSLLVSEHPDSDALKKVFQSFKDNGIAVEFLEQEQLHAMEPNLADSVKYGIFFKDVGHTVNPEKLCFALYQLFLEQGGQFHQVEVNKVEQQGSQAAVVTESKEYQHQQVIIASGAWSKPLANHLGYKVPLDTERGYHLMLPDNQSELSIPVASLERKFIMTPMSAGLRLAGTVEFAGLEAPANQARARALLPHAKSMLRTKVPEQADSLPDWMGFRPSLPDSLPVIGRAPKHNKVIFAFGHQHLGLTQAAISGKLITELINGQATSIDLRPFCISRFQ